MLDTAVSETVVPVRNRRNQAIIESGYTYVREYVGLENFGRRMHLNESRCINNELCMARNS
jgi:hypothetical protein